MDETQFLGYLIVAVVTLGGFIGVIMKFTQPINDLRVVIQKLNDNIESLKQNNDAQNKRLDSHDNQIDKLDRRVGKIETKIDLFHKNN